MQDVYRLLLMNLHLHKIDPDHVDLADTLSPNGAQAIFKNADLILTSPVRSGGRPADARRPDHHRPRVVLPVALRRALHPRAARLDLRHPMGCATIEDDRLAIDTNVIISAFRSRSGASFALIELVRRKKIRRLATPPLLPKYEAMLKRPEQLAASGVSPADVDTALNGMAALIDPVETHLSWRPQLDNPDDEMVLEAAINGRADALVMYNTVHFRTAAARFGIRLACPVEILREVIEP